ncbi:MAG TPA: DUF2807 domain-containing protein, partial [Bacteroidota bacterium]|nr:DUF2807 domain-containing protein [Bacteroidota bacterium]
MKHSSKYLILCLVIASLTVPACVLVDSDHGIDTGHDQHTIIGSGHIVVVSFSFRDFYRITLSQSFKATIRKSSSYAVRVELDDNIQQYLMARQSGGALSIGLEDNSYKDITVNVTIETPDAEYIEASGAGSIRMDGFTVDHDVQIVASGATSFSGTLSARTVGLTLTGSSTVDFDGGATSLNVYGTGATQLALFDFPVKNCKVTMIGGSVSNVRVSDDLEVSLTGGSVLRYIGNPAT